MSVVGGEILHSPHLFPNVTLGSWIKAIHKCGKASMWQTCSEHGVSMLCVHAMWHVHCKLSIHEYVMCMCGECAIRLASFPGARGEPGNKATIRLCMCIICYQVDRLQNLCKFGIDNRVMKLGDKLGCI